MRNKTKNFILLHYIYVTYNLLKRMTFKYIAQVLILLSGIIALSSCLNTNNTDLEASTDAQIYAVRTTASYDSTGTLSNAKYTIDQLRGEVYNRDSLDFGFVPKNVLLTVTHRGASGIRLFLQNPDSVYIWQQSDSVNISRLRNIEVVAQDGITSKKYDFKLNIHKQNPDILVWNKLSDSYIPTSATAQKTIFFNNKYLTYYLSDTGIHLLESSDAVTTSEQLVTGLPTIIQLNSIVHSSTGLVALDNEGNAFRSIDGRVWEMLATPYSIKAIYGIMPSATGSYTLLAVDDGGAIKFASTTNFTEYQIKNNLPAGFPVQQYTAARIEKPEVFSAKYLVLTGGVDNATTQNSKVWILQDKNNSIEVTTGASGSIITKASTLFTYDGNLYLLTTSGIKNALYISSTYGLNWQIADNNQILPANFVTRTNASVVTDDKNYIRIFGGRSTTQTELTDLWRGRLNKLAIN